MIETYTWHETPGDGETVVGHMNVAWPAIQKGSIGLTDVTWFSFSISDKNGSWTFGTAFLTT
jgi:hypothetical protein